MLAYPSVEMVPAGTDPSPLLIHLAGDFAPAIARLWPAPHAVFLTAPAARRHLTCLALSIDMRRGRKDLDSALCGLFRRAVKDLTPGPPGLTRALGRLGEVAWSAQDYGLLLECLAEPECGRLLHHSEVIDANLIRRLYSLPNDLFAAGAVRLALNERQTDLISECYLALRRRDGQAAAAALARRWAEAPNAAEAFRRVEEDLLPEPAPPPIEGTARLRPLATKAAIIDAASRYRNCLKTRIPDAALGNSAIYEWIGEPSAVVEIYRDTVYGWRLDEGKLQDNQSVESPLREAIVAELESMGVYVGYSSWRLVNAVCNGGDGARWFQPRSEAIADMFS